MFILSLYIFHAGESLYRYRFYTGGPENSRYIFRDLLNPFYDVEYEHSRYIFHSVESNFSPDMFFMPVDLF